MLIISYICTKFYVWTSLPWFYSYLGHYKSYFCFWSSARMLFAISRFSASSVVNIPHAWNDTWALYSWKTSVHCSTSICVCDADLASARTVFPLGLGLVVEDEPTELSCLKVWLKVYTVWSVKVTPENFHVITYELACHHQQMGGELKIRFVLWLVCRNMCQQQWKICLVKIIDQMNLKHFQP